MTHDDLVSVSKLLPTYTIDNSIYEGWDAKIFECGGSFNGDSCNGEGGLKGIVTGVSFTPTGFSTNTRFSLVGSGGAGYLTDGESVCGKFSGLIQGGQFKIEDCNGSNVLAQGGHAYVNGNKGGFEPTVAAFPDSFSVPGGSGGFGGGGQGK